MYAEFGTSDLRNLILIENAPFLCVYLEALYQVRKEEVGKMPTFGKWKQIACHVILAWHTLTIHFTVHFLP